MSDFIQGAGEVTIPEGESYSAANGISLQAAGDDTVNNYSDIGGQTYITYRILWTVTRGAGEGTEGQVNSGNGITGQGWYLSHSTSPFYGATADAIETAAFNGTINNYFNNWYTTGNEEEVATKITQFIRTTGVISCVDFYPATSPEQ